MKGFYYVACLMLFSLFILSGCGKRSGYTKENDSLKEAKVLDTIYQIKATSEKMMLKTRLESYCELVEIEDLVNNLAKEPDWSMENFGSLDNFVEFLNVPKVLTDIYDEHERNGTINKYGEVYLYILDGDKYEYFASLYKKDQVCHIKYRFESDYERKYFWDFFEGDVVNSGIFKNGENIVTICMTTFSNDSNVHWSEIFIQELLADSFKYNEHNEPLDTFLLDDKEFQIIMNGKDFSVVLYNDTNEVVCVKNSKEIGPRIVVDKSDKITENNGQKYYVNSENTIVKPVIQKNSIGVSFHFVHLGKMSECIVVDNMLYKQIYAKVNEVVYPIMSKNIICYIEGATRYN